VNGADFAARWTGEFSTPSQMQSFQRPPFKPGESAGTLFGRSLLPKNAQIHKISLDPSKPQTQLFGGDFTFADLKKCSYGHRWGLPLSGVYFKLEVAPARANKRDLFLHVLQASNKGVAKMAPCELIERGARSGAKLTLGNREVEVVFDKDGKLGGAISIKERGKELVAKELPKEVVDSYLDWKGDPRFQQWMTEKRFDIVIPEADRKAYQTRGR
jgi:hypothetical protein